ncbi:ICOS ligand-like [Sardina pilchardus]|uniref:ICOS ligand-like n=1 Tax=Sardina pilchardus TaxID=27697 RepID=UPI002E0F14A9
MAPRWFVVLLLGLVKQSSSQEDECSVGVIGESAILPCVYNGTQSLLRANISARWRSETEEMLRGMWTQGEAELVNVSSVESSRVRMSSLCPQTGDFSMTLTDLVPMDAKTYSLHISFDGEETSSVLCTVCLKVGAHFSFPSIQRGEADVERQTQFVCHSRGGYPQPALHWFINSTDQPPAGSVRTYAQPLQDSELYNITSVLTVSIAAHLPVTCTVENRILNETFSTINWPEEEQASPVVARASEAMWVFSTVVIIIVGLLVAVGVLFQVKWDRERQRPHGLHDDDSDTEDTDITVDMEHLDSLTDTHV